VKKDIIIILITRKINNIYLFNKKNKSLGLINYKLSLKLSKNKLKSYSNNYTDNKFNNNSELNEDNKRLSPINQK
jgi:hypothetical protein